MKYLPLILPLLIAAVAFFAFSESGRALVHDFLSGAGRSGRLPYKRRPVMTDNELDFHRTLRSALPAGNWELWPQVSMAAFVAPINEGAAKDPAQRKQFWAAYGKIANSRVDWVVARHGEAFCVVELDDRTHERAKDVERDAIVASAGLPTLRFQSRRKPDENMIRNRLVALSQ